MIDPSLSDGQFSPGDADLLGHRPSYQPETADLQLLAEIGLSAAIKGDAEVSRPIFEALALWRPDHPISAIGMALALISEGEVESAISLLKPAMQIEPPSLEVAAILLLALTLAERWNEARVLKKTLLNGPDGPSKMIALRLAPIIDA